jgi:hypothetical protein
MMHRCIRIDGGRAESIMPPPILARRLERLQGPPILVIFVRSHSTAIKFGCNVVLLRVAGDTGRFRSLYISPAREPSRREKNN